MFSLHIDVPVEAWKSSWKKKIMQTGIIVPMDQKVVGIISARVDHTNSRSPSRPGCVPASGAPPRPRQSRSSVTSARRRRGAGLSVFSPRKDRMRPEDVGLSSDMAFFRARDVAQRNPTITHTTIYKSENFSLVILFLPQNAIIPLHNHPGMTVFSKLLLGSMHIKSYDWVGADPAESGASSPADGLRLAQLVVDDDFTAPCDTSVLYPTAGGNMHRFRAIAPCAILDVLGPPYSIEEDRDCTYYTDVPYSQHPMTGTELINNEQEGRRLAWLKEIEMPGDLKMCSVRYGGPQVSDR